MEELLEFGRGEYEASRWFTDETTSNVVEVSAEVSKPMFTRFMELRSLILQQQSEIKFRFVFIGMALQEIFRDKLYLYVTPKDGVVGYSNFYTFCTAVFGLKKTTAQNMLDIAREYCGEDGNLKLPYLNYSYTQLVEMLPMEEKNRLRIPVTLSTRKIKALNKYYKTNVPKETIEEDLADYELQRKEENERRLEKKNAITFIPAKKVTETEYQALGTPQDFDGEDERDVITPDVQKPSFDAVREGLYMQLHLLRQCWQDQGEGMYAVWDSFCTHIETALRNRFPDYIVPYNQRGNADAKDLTSDEFCDLLVPQFENLRSLLPSLHHAFCDIVVACLKNRRLTVYSEDSYNLLFKRNQALRLELAEYETNKTDSVKGKAASGKLSLKNKKERQEWLEKFHDWGVWLSVPEVSKTFYRYDFENGCSLIVEESLEFSWQYYVKGKDEYSEHSFVRYAIIDEKHPKYDSAYQGGASGIVEWLSKHSKEI